MRRTASLGKRFFYAFFHIHPQCIFIGRKLLAFRGGVLVGIFLVGVCGNIEEIEKQDRSIYIK